MRNIFHELHYAIRIFFLNPIIFLRKFFNRIFLFLVPWPKDKTQVKIGEHIIQTQPSRNLWRKSICFRQCDIEIEDNLKKYLSPSGVFIDAGAGIGYFSAIASDIVGGSGKVHCFEPNPFCGESITKMIKNSPNSNIIFNNCALGNYNGSHKYYI
ncbi:MAG: FkbM family methyltransferase, partial [Candidatus Omnitrophota bacterium]